MERIGWTSPGGLGVGGMPCQNVVHNVCVRRRQEHNYGYGMRNNRFQMVNVLPSDAGVSYDAFEGILSMMSASSVQTLLATLLHGDVEHGLTLASSVADNASSFSSSSSSMLTLGLEPIVLPCSSMNCGDMTHRSTLDPVLRMEQRGINPYGVGVILLILSYLSAKPGVLPGFVDTYIQAPIQRFRAKAYGKEDIKMGKKLATGGFGTVYLGELVDPDDGKVTPVVVKKAKEFGEAETWMNERMMRAAPKMAAEFITAFADGDGREGEPLWLVWKYEGNYTLAELMQKKDFFSILESMLFDRPLNIPEGPERRAVVLRLVFQQLLETVAACHKIGICHRDVKPQNCIFSAVDRRVKLIDFGAAADLRIGINYVPNQYLLDPRYAPPEQYVMSAQTPKAPSAPVAALLSPILWRLNNPDRFDMWSAGITLLQLAIPPLRSDTTLVNFNKQLESRYNWDLRAWRAAAEWKLGKEWRDGLATLDALGGGGWDLVVNLVQYEPINRISAVAALAHPWFDQPSPLVTVAGTVETIGRVAGKVAEDVDAGWLANQMARSGTVEAGGFTEAQLIDSIEKDSDSTVSGNGGMPSGLGASSTIAWWQSRQKDIVRARQKRPRSSSEGNGLKKPIRREDLTNSISNDENLEAKKPGLNLGRLLKLGKSRND